MFHGFDFSGSRRGTGGSGCTRPARGAGAHPRAGGRQEALLQAVTELSKAFALAVPHEEALRIRDEVGFFQAVRAGLVKSAGDGRYATEEDLDPPSGRSSRRAV